MAKVGVIENTIQVISQKIEVLEDKLQNEIKQSDQSSKISKCDHCDYNASTSTVLKCHTTSKQGKYFSKKKKEVIRLKSYSSPSVPSYPTRKS